MAVVTHGGVIRSLLWGMLKIPFHKKLLFGTSLENTSITHIVYEKENNGFYLEGEPTLLRKSWNNL